MTEAPISTVMSRIITEVAGLPPDTSIDVCAEQEVVGLSVGQASRGFSPDEALAVAKALTIAAWEAEGKPLAENQRVVLARMTTKKGEMFVCPEDLCPEDYPA